MKKQSNDIKNQLIRNSMLFVIGGMIGAAVMWLTAPMTGGETRRILSEKLADARVNANMAIENAQMKVRQISDNGRREVEEQMSRIEGDSGEFGPAATGY